MVLLDSVVVVVVFVNMLKFCFSKGPVSLLSLWSDRIDTANGRKHQEFVGRLNSVSKRAGLYQHLKEEVGMETVANGKGSRQ